MRSDGAHHTYSRSNGARSPASPRPGPEPTLPDLELDGWFSSDPKPVLVIDASGRLVMANRAASELLDAETAVALRRRQLVFADGEAQSAFTNAVAEAQRKGDARAIVRGNDGQWRPVDLRAWRRSGDQLVFVSFCGEPASRLELAGLVQAFELTAAEVEVLRLLTAGSSPKDIARQLAVSTNTVRAHLRALYIKMHVRGMVGVLRQVLRLVR